MRRVVSVVAALLSLAFATPALAATYYVSPAGDDAAAGTAAGTAWRTVDRVNRSALAPGDTVLFQGGQTFSDATLMPRASGTSASPITYASYGTGQANLSRGVWMISVANLVFDNLAVIGADPSTQGIASTPQGNGVIGIAVQRCTFRNVSLAINLPNAADAGWTIKNNAISHTGDSGMLVQGHDVLVSGNTISNTGENAAITYGKHGVYAKGPAISVLDNTISSFSDDGVSIRYQNDVVENNRISDGPIGVGAFQDSSVGGTSMIAYNTIRNVSDAGIYLNGSPVESFVIANNTIQTTGGAGMDLRAVRGLTVANNAVTGKSVYAFEARPPAAGYSEHHNLWYSSTETTLSWNGQTLSLAAYRAASGQGAADVLATPLVDDSLLPQSGSPLINAGSTSVAGVSYILACDGQPLHYCGTAPDIGARESTVIAPPPPDTIAPIVSITVPPNGASVRRSIVVNATATDASGIRSVVFLLDGQVVCADTTAAYQCTMTLKRGKHVIVARATDIAGNVALASVTVTAS